MERPLQDPLLARTAQDPEALPFELIEPILKELPFLRTLDLFVLPGSGSRLRDAIRYYSRWVHLLGEETDDIDSPVMHRRDRSSSKLPSLLALYMSPWPSPRAIAIAQLLAPYRQCNHDLLQLLYESKVSEIRRLLKGAPARKTPEDGRSIIADEIARDDTDSLIKILKASTIETQDNSVKHSVPERDLVTTANALQRLFKEMTLSANASGSEILAHILAQVENLTEKQNKQDGKPWKVTVQNYLASRIRAGNTASIEGLTTRQLATDTPPAVDEPARGSSWVQSLAEIPYKDVISAHSVNAFVPLIPVRELLPVMSDSSSGSSGSSRGSAPSPGHAHGFIVNVSSREGIFEQTDRGAWSAKNGKHVHTNMSKAALSMITETEAAEAWRTVRVAMNMVDPGYMSAAPELDAIRGKEMPIGWEGGASRVLWPIAVGELEKIGEEGCYAVWGRFLKHYGAARVNLQQGLR
ncbi:hypothetical protein F5B21DRAFT_501215 [Xylaria acuta]|nr:hypothetical protein F5B21DRAFT_501215 [Xylaria acuta]